MELVNDRWEVHAVRRQMFVPTSQFHLYGHVTSHGNRGNSGDGDGDGSDDDDDDDDNDGDEDDAPQLTVICRAARDVRFYLLNVFLVLVFINHLSNCQARAATGVCWSVSCSRLSKLSSSSSF